MLADRMRAIGGLSPIDQYIKALLHFDTLTKDETGRIWTACGNARIDTVQSKFGGTSGYFDGSNSWIDTPDSIDFDATVDYFTVDFWLRCASTANSPFIFGQEADASSAIGIGLRIASNQFHLSYNMSDARIISFTVMDGTWYHIAIVKQLNLLKMYVNGSQVTSISVSGDMYNASGKFAIGRIGQVDNYYFNGWIDEFRYSKDIARWTANFTPPTSPY